MARHHRPGNLRSLEAKAFHRVACFAPGIDSRLCLTYAVRRACPSARLLLRKRRPRVLKHAWLIKLGDRPPHVAAYHLHIY